MLYLQRRDVKTLISLSAILSIEKNDKSDRKSYSFLLLKLYMKSLIPLQKRVSTCFETRGVQNQARLKRKSTYKEVLHNLFEFKSCFYSCYNSLFIKGIGDFPCNYYWGGSSLEVFFSFSCFHFFLFYFPFSFFLSCFSFFRFQVSIFQILPLPIFHFLCAN